MGAYSDEQMSLAADVVRGLPASVNADAKLLNATTRQALRLISGGATDRDDIAARVCRWLAWSGALDGPRSPKDGLGPPSTGQTLSGLGEPPTAP